MNFAQLASEIDIYVEIQISGIPFVGFQRKHAANFFALLHRQTVFEVEYCLLPVGVRRFRRGAEADTFVAFRKFDREERDERLNIVVSSDDQIEWNRKR